MNKNKDMNIEQTLPHARQWWRLRRNVNGFEQSMHIIVSWSLIHVGALLPSSSSLNYNQLNCKQIRVKNNSWHLKDLGPGAPTRITSQILDQSSGSHNLPAIDHRLGLRLDVRSELVRTSLKGWDASASAVLAIKAGMTLSFSLQQDEIKNMF